MTIIFKAKTHEAYTIKILSELLQNTIKTACLEVHTTGINFRMMDSHRTILIDIVLESSSFNIFEKTHSDVMYLGLNLNHFYRMLKAIKKKDALCIFIDDQDPNKLFLQVFPKERNRITTSAVHIQNIQNIEISLPTGYNNPVIIPSGEYQRTLKDMNNISEIVTVTMKKYSMMLSCTADNVFSREVLFGELEDDTLIQYKEDFDMEHLTRILKVAGLSKNIYVYSKPKLPLLIQSNVGDLGLISIYIKSKSQIKLENLSD